MSTASPTSQLSTEAVPADRRTVTVLAVVHLAGWLGALVTVAAIIGPARLDRIVALLIQGEQWLVLALAVALVVVPVVSALAIWRWRGGRGPWVLLLAAALSMASAALALGRWPHLVPWWIWCLAIITEGCGLLAAYLALARPATAAAD